MVAHESQVFMRGLNHYPDAATALNSDLFFTLSNHALIIVHKFIEIWDDSGTVAAKEPRMREARRAITPLIDRIEVWKGLREQRHTALAHAYLDKNNVPVSPWSTIVEGSAPSHHAEIVLLLQIVSLAVLSVLTVFESEYTAIDELARPDASFVPPVGPGIANGAEIRDALKPIADEVAARLKSHCNVVVGGPLLQTFMKATVPRTT